MMNLSMGEGAVLANSDLTKATISMASEFEQGGTFQNVKFGRNVDGLDFSGLELKNVTIDGKLIQRASDLDQFGVTYDKNNPPEVSASAEATQKAELAQIRETMQNAVGGIGGPSNGPAPTQTAQASARVIESLAEVNPNNTLDGLARADGIKQANRDRNGGDPIAAAIAAMVAAGVSRGEEATSTGTGTAVAMLKRTVDPEEQASGANMQRSSSGNA